MRLGIFQRFDMVVNQYRNHAGLVRNIAAYHQHDAEFADSVGKAENRPAQKTGFGERHGD